MARRSDSSKHPRASAAEHALVERCHELEAFVKDEPLQVNPTEYLERWDARTAHSIEEHLGRHEKDRFLRARLRWRDRVPLPSSASSAANHRIGYMLPLLQELRDHPNDLFARLDAEGGRRSGRHILRGDAVFIVHGHNHKLKDEVAAFLHRIHGKRPTILHEMPDGGLTIIEKLEHYASEACFAVVLLTADDPRFPKEAALRRKFPDKRPQRARQNVILELGYFWAKLGRTSVVILYEDGIELPSDADGVLYKQVDASGGWKQELAKEMENAGLEVDLPKGL